MLALFERLGLYAVEKVAAQNVTKSQQPMRRELTHGCEHAFLSETKTLRRKEAPESASAGAQRRRMPAYRCCCSGCSGSMIVTRRLGGSMRLMSALVRRRRKGAQTALAVARSRPPPMSDWKEDAIGNKEGLQK